MRNQMRPLKVAIISLILTLCSLNLKAQTHRYIQNHKDVAMELSEKYGIPSSVILAIAFVETGGGKSKNAKQLNNHFGIVGKNHNLGSRYKKFESVRASYEGFCKLLTRKKYYSRLKGNNDFSAWIVAIAKAGYTTQPKEWKRRLNLIYDKFNLSDL
ncbi:glucosaminidase domain-containing protein [Riemerella columbina]|uniref:glucosaminidase domain-containing protein n=1 Tax=Riemerella columbina TaxID=103810 RepID=UPI00037F706E|nr:glucosaminidase domain-containing protein [Riemerella columbina]